MKGKLSKNRILLFMSLASSERLRLVMGNDTWRKHFVSQQCNTIKETSPLRN